MSGGISSWIFFSLFLFVCLFFGFFLIFWPRHTACRILVPRPGIEPAPPAMKAQSLNHWTTREVPPHGFDVHFPKTNDVEHLLMCSLAVCTSSTEKCLFIYFTFFFFLIGLFVLVFSYTSSLCILDTSALADIYLQIFSFSLWLIF